MALNNSQRRKLSVFLKCLLFSVVAWLLFAASNQYVFIKAVAISYVNAPDNRAFIPLQMDTAQLRVEATGWQLLFSSMTRDERAVEVDISSLAQRNFVIFSNQIGYINRQFPSNQRVLSVTPDTLYFDFSKQTEKKVPVKALYDVQFSRQFGIIDAITTTPEYVTIRGPLEDVASIDFWETDTLRIRNAQHPIQRSLALNTKSHSNIKVFPTQVDIQVPIGELTEKEIEVSVSVENDEQVRSVRVLPSKVKITVLVSLRDFASLSSTDFDAVVDLQSWHDWNVSSLPVIITKMPEFCQLVRVQPQNLDFFVNN